MATKGATYFRPSMTATPCVSRHPGPALLLSLALFVVLPLSAFTEEVYGGGSKGWSDWTTVLDGVMGGLSSGTMETSGESLRFYGDISIDGGGFSSVSRRFYDAPVDLTEAAGFLVTIDTLPELEVPLALDVSLDSVGSFWSHGATFAVQPGPTGTKQQFFLPLDSFTRAQWRGFRCHSDCEMDASAIRQISLYVLFQEGPFDLRIHRIETINSPPLASSIISPEVLLSSAADTVDLLEAAASRASALYDYEYPELSVAVSAAAIDTVRAASGPPQEVKDAMCTGLNRALQGGSSQESAWILRRAIDAAVAGLSGSARPAGDSYPVVARGDWLDSDAVCAADAWRKLSTESVAAVVEPEGSSPFGRLADFGQEMGST